MNRNDVVVESFITYCDEMMIPANESASDVFRKLKNGIMALIEKLLSWVKQLLRKAPKESKQDLAKVDKDLHDLKRKTASSQTPEQIQELPDKVQELAKLLEKSQHEVDQQLKELNVKARAYADNSSDRRKKLNEALSQLQKEDNISSERYKSTHEKIRKDLNSIDRDLDALLSD